jgi:hypothetical protein
MSRRVNYKLNIKDMKKEIAIEALKLAGCSYTERGDLLHITQAPKDYENLRNSSINTSTWEISGDSDYGHNANDFGNFRQVYKEAEIRHEAMKNGGSVTEREVLGDRIRLRVAYG